jgi:cyclin-dependent kinase-like
MQSKYEVIGIVGEGAYGVVYKCKNKETGEFVALKKFKEIEDDLVKKTMMRELKVLQMLKHDNIVEYKEAFKRKGDLFLVFEYVDKNLLELLQEHPRGLDPLVIKKLIYQLCKAIKYLHDMNIVHRDIKPENLLVDSNLKLKLCDFGFARTIKKNNDKLTDYVATRWYRSPELLITSGYYGPEVDYWAIGCIMGELADGDPLFPGDNELDQLDVIQKVLGKLPDYQQELFYNNPNYKGRKLPDVNKPETIERRYLGKLTKQAISFLKGLLNPDPKLRLKGDAVFSHPFFENYPDPFPSSKVQPSNNNMISTNSTNIQINNLQKDTKENNSNSQNANLNKENTSSNVNNNTNNINNLNSTNSNLNSHINTNSSIATENLVNISKPPAQVAPMEKKQKIIQPIITNTTNINIINYNNFDTKPIMNNTSHLINHVPIVNQKNKNNLSDNKNFVKNPVNQKIYNHNNLPGNMVLTSYNFNQNPKDNLLKLYNSTTFHKNFKTFYKGDPYNFDIDMNFVREKRSENKALSNEKNGSSLLVIDEEKASTKRNSKPNENAALTFTTKESVKSPYKNKKTSILPHKNMNVMHGMNEDLFKMFSNKPNNSKIVTKSNTIVKNVNPNSTGMYHLPNINNKNFSLKKLLK